MIRTTPSPSDGSIRSSRRTRLWIYPGPHPRVTASPLSLEERAFARVSKDGRESALCVHPSRRLLRKLLRMRSETYFTTSFSGTTRGVWSSSLAHSIPPRTRPRHQLVIAVHHLHRRTQAGGRGAHPHLARHLAVGWRQPDAFVPPQARTVL